MFLVRLKGIYLDLCSGNLAPRDGKAKPASSGCLSKTISKSKEISHGSVVWVHRPHALDTETSWKQGLITLYSDGWWYFIMSVKGTLII